MHDLLHKNSILEISVLLGGILQFRIITSPYVFTPPPSKKKTTNKSKDSIIYYSSNIYDLYPKMSGKITFFTYQAYPFTMQFLVFWHIFENYKKTISSMSCIKYCLPTKIFPIPVFNSFLILAAVLLSYFTTSYMCMVILYVIGNPRLKNVLWRVFFYLLEKSYRIWI